MPCSWSSGKQELHLGNGDSLAGNAVRLRQRGRGVESCVAVDSREEICHPVPHADMVFSFNVDQQMDTD